MATSPMSCARDLCKPGIGDLCEKEGICLGQADDALRTMMKAGKKAQGGTKSTCSILEQVAADMKKQKILLRPYSSCDKEMVNCAAAPL